MPRACQNEMGKMESMDMDAMIVEKISMRRVYHAK